MLTSNPRQKIFLFGLLLATLSSSAFAHLNFDVNFGFSAPPPEPPAMHVMVAPPQGYNDCYVTAGMWINNVWVPPHQQCEYVSSSGPAVWVSGYWGCADVGPGGHCGHWRWYHHRTLHRQVSGYISHTRQPQSGYQAGPQYHEGPAYINAPSYGNRGPQYHNEPARGYQSGPSYGHRDIESGR